MTLRSKGFTLFEFIVVMILVSILAAYASIRTPSTTVFSQSSVTEQIKRDIRYTQTLAMSLNTSYRIIFSTNSYTISPTTPDGVYTVNMPSGITLSPGTIIFNATGAPISAASVTITATGGGSTTISVSAETGFVND
jgi:MSHA pilin protein MshC